MTSVPRFKYTFTPSWPMILLAFIFIALFMKLGFWQLARADEKKQLQNAFNIQLQKPPIIWQAKDQKPSQYQALKIKGKFLPISFFLDNQHHKHKFGYDVLLPLLLDNGDVVIIDKGWVAADIKDRYNLPKIKISDYKTEIIGRAYYPSSKNWVLGDAIEKRSSSVAIIETIDVPIISKFLQKAVYPFIIREEKSFQDDYVREWSIVSMPPTRHYGYAVQWFSFALVVFIIFIFLNIKKKA